jgi:uncharacterized protein HemX
MGNTVAEELSEQQQKNNNNEQVQPKPVKDTQKRSIGWLIFGIINFILILLLAGSGYYLLQEMKEKQLDQSSEINKDDMREIEVSKQLNVFQSQLGSIQSQIATINEDITGKDNHFTKTLADFSQLHTEKLDSTRKELFADVGQLKRQLGKTRGDWLIADAEYLLSVANQRLHLMGDVKTTRMALEAADQRLRESGDSAVFKVREQIAKEIAGLRTVSLPDVVGMYSSIQILKDKVAQLAVLLPYAGKPLTESKQVHDHEQSQDAEHGILNAALSLLEGYVTVKHSDQPVTEIITQEEVEFIRLQLGVKLEMIKISLVQQNDALFQSSIADTKQWLNKNFTRNVAAKNFQQELDRLNAIPIRGEFPDVSKSLKLLKDITKLRIETDKAQIERETKPVSREVTNTPAIQVKPVVQVKPKPPVVPVEPVAPVKSVTP